MSRDSERPHLRDSYKLLTTAARLIQRRQEQALAPLGLTRAAVIALEAVASRPMNQEQLAAKVHVQGQTLGRVLARLESQGLVTRTRNAADRRQLQVKLTQAGKTALNAARQAEVDAFPVARDDDGWDALQEQLTKFIASFQAPQPVEQAHARSNRQLLESTPERAQPPASPPGPGHNTRWLAQVEPPHPEAERVPTRPAQDQQAATMDRPEGQ
jgi:MarR family transcriptional regulator, organic hydroperoxide resistance regulator